MLIRQPPIFQMTIDAQAAFITEVQTACRKAKTSKSTADLEAARVLMDVPKLSDLPREAQENLRWAYAEALMAVTGGLVP